jgi:hypothetical protein
MGRAYVPPAASSSAAKGLAGAAAPVRCMHARRHTRMMHTYAYGIPALAAYARTAVSSCVRTKSASRIQTGSSLGVWFATHRASSIDVSCVQNPNDTLHCLSLLAPDCRHQPTYEYDPTSSLRRPQQARASHARCQLKNAFYCSSRH